MHRAAAVALVFVFACAGCASPASGPRAAEANAAVDAYPATSTPPLGHSTATQSSAFSPGPPQSARDQVAAPAPLPDATQGGPLAWKRVPYDFGTLIVTDPTTQPYQYPARVNGTVTFPTAPGTYPLILLLHGRHGTCSAAGLQVIFVPCANAFVVEPINSLAGYNYLGENLASHGYVVASANANDINDKDLVGDSGANARAQLVLHTLDEFAAVNQTGTAPDPPVGAVPIPDLTGRIDLSRIGLMGHSRGGEGVARALTLDQELGSHHSIVAIFALAPTDFRRSKIGNAAFATLLPYCDGDVSNLQGAWMYDDARATPETQGTPRFQVLAMGANHNFYNTVWTSDDWSATDPWCGHALPGGGRDTPALQRKHGVGLMASFFRLYVGHEQAFAQFWDGSAGMPDWLCQGACANRLHVSRHAAPPDRIVLDADGTHGTVKGFTTHKACSPGTCPGKPTIGAAAQVALAWKEDASIRYQVGSDLRAWRAVTLRLGVPTGAQPGTVLLELGDAAGKRAAVQLPTSDDYAPPGGSSAAKTVLSMARVPLSAFPGIDLAHVVQVELQFRGAGAAQVNDVMIQR